ncbi:MAG: DUF6164 family protein [Halorhodospira halophila]|uniref:DUF6164 family protein n=1 Tax=Halorhodospira TaxID=85108 RepID=UPI001912E83C|nr:MULTISPECIES: DUF6164 family protein [Halorhodospira]MBK5937519.1 hypothetical protein [Halorhodospira halophila]MBK5942500.1 hypothetical protein [Halorhodospira halophila]MCC3751018.1 DUF6164 family protein [Halorhodospira halophila]MCG5528281.1 DUF6164 family protein [Halorhodospira halophila]MCG5532050.1 DUF6164 family protein [Halorhodospira sp. 9621]
MAKLLLNLRGVPEDEADEVRGLLEQYHLDYYETPPNRWGITQGGIWLRDAEQYPQAKRLLDEYQRRRFERVRGEHEAMRRRGELETVTQRILREPLRFLIYFLLMAVILAFMTIPFLHLALSG